MISLECVNNEIIATPIDVGNALKKMRLIDNKKWDNSIKAWIAPKSEFNNIISLFGLNIDFKSPIEDFLEENETNIYSSADDFEGIKFTPFPFQVVGANFAVYKEKSLIADYMGLGKTLQAVLAIIKLKSLGKIKKVLIVTPASVKFQWQGEIESKTDLSSFVVKTPSDFSGKTASIREEKALAQFENNENLIYIVNYETLLNKVIFDELKKLDFDMAIFDEIHYAKNKDSKRSKQAYEISRGIDYILGLSGTPLENSPLELFGVFRIIDNTLFPNWSYFAHAYIKYARYGIISEFIHMPKLRSLIQPYIIRRTLKDVALELPEKIYDTKYIEMTGLQRDVHDRIYSDIYDIFEKLKDLRRKFGNYDINNPPESIKNLEASVLSKFAFLLEVCDSPELISISDSKAAKQYAIDDDYSPKLEYLMEIITQVMSQKDKIVIYTQYTRMIKIITDRIKKDFKGIDYTVIDGSMSPKQKALNMEHFNKSSDCNIMIISNAGGTGLNLQTANYMVIFDPPLKPSLYDQIVGRIIRIGSEHSNAFIINLVMQDGWDMKIFDILDKKRKYSKDLIDKTNDETLTFNLAADSIQSDLKKLVKKAVKSRKKI